MRTLKGATSVCVLIPARDESATIDGVVTRLLPALQPDAHGIRLVDDLVVVDCGSLDDTAARAVAAGARVVNVHDVLTDIPVVLGKGEALWRGLAATDADIVVFIDADLPDVDDTWIAALIGPMLADDSVQFVKAAYDRPTDEHGVGGGRVTELVARPLLSLHWPTAAGVQQPIGGEYAARRELLEQLNFACGYGVDFGLLVDTVQRCGIDAVAQVDLGVRRHRNRPTRQLGRTAAEIWLAAAHRLNIDIAGDRDVLTQFARFDDHVEPVTIDLVSQERPPLRKLRETRATQTH